MARKYNNNYGNNRNSRNNSGNRNYGKKRKSQFTNIERTAFQMGIVMGSINGKDNRINDSFEAGMRALEDCKKPKKPLF